jgi:isocitrate dehydrogenase
MMLEYMGWKEASELIRAAYVQTLDDKIVTYDFARQMEGATEVSTSGFADAIIERIKGDIDIEALRAQREKQLEQERKEREIKRLLQPLEEMVESGRMPHSVNDIMTRSMISVPNDCIVDDAMLKMREHKISSVVVETGEDGEWGIMTRRDVLSRIVGANRSTSSVSVGEICSRPALTVAPETSLHDAAEFLTKNNISRALVEQGGKIIGIASETDIFDAVETFGWIPE